jgi:16S rRNA (cytidine1402-2'-O)-methyltransferase
VVATPIGNLHEFSPRAVDILKNVDIIAAEDTRTSAPLLRKFEISTHLIAHHNYNENESSKGIVELLKGGKNVAIISDAGYPLISDPGYALVKECVDNDINVVPISGPSAGINAIVASGLVAQPYIFYGFLSSNQNEARKELEKLQNYPMTLIFYVSPHKVTKTLEVVKEVFGDRRACLARELTKKFEEFNRGLLSEIIPITSEIKGEMVLVVEGYVNKEPAMTLYEINMEVINCINNGISAKEAIKKIAKKHNVSKNELYNEYHKHLN